MGKKTAIEVLLRDRHTFTIEACRAAGLPDEMILKALEAQQEMDLAEARRIDAADVAKRAYAAKERKDRWRARSESLKGVSVAPRNFVAGGQ